MYLELLLIMMLFFQGWQYVWRLKQSKRFYKVCIWINLSYYSRKMTLIRFVHELTHGNRYKIAHKIETIRTLCKYSVCFAGFL